MAFCTKCGKEIKKGETCSCEKTNKVKDTAEKVSAAVEKTLKSEEVTSTWNSFVEILKGIFTKPVSTVKKHSTKKNYILGLIVIGVNAFICGIYTFFLVKRAYQGLTFILGKIPFFRTFFAGFMGILIFFALVIGLLFFITNIIMKEKLDIRNVVSLVGVAAVYPTLTLVGAVLINLFAPSIALIIIIASIIVFTILIYHGLLLKTDLTDNKALYTVMPTLAFATIIGYLLIKLIAF